MASLPSFAMAWPIGEIAEGEASWRRQDLGSESLELGESLESNFLF